MKNNLWLILFTLLLSSCQFANSSIVSSSQLMSSQSSTFLPNSSFIPEANGRTFLIEEITEFQYQSQANGVLDPLPLSPINFPVTEEIVTPYTVANAVASDWSDETIVWNQDGISLFGLEAFMPNQIIPEASLRPWLAQQTPKDQGWTQLEKTRVVRDFSAQYFNGDYYWFNHYLRRDTSVIKRYDNSVTYGTGQSAITFQTGVEIQPTFAYQIHADASTIYEIYDETYPVGFFGARDRQYRTVRASGNFQQALSLSPLQLFNDWMNVIPQENFWPQSPLLETPNAYQWNIFATKPTSQSITLTLQAFRGANMLEANETLAFIAHWNGQSWSQVTQTYYLWKPLVP